MSVPCPPSPNERLSTLERCVRQLREHARWVQARLTALTPARPRVVSGGMPRTVLAAPTSWINGGIGRRRGLTSAVSPMAPNIVAGTMARHRVLTSAVVTLPMHTYSGALTRHRKSTSAVVTLPMHTYSGALTRHRVPSSSARALSLTLLNGAVARHRKPTSAVVQLGAMSGLHVVSGALTRRRVLTSTVTRNLPGIYPTRWTCWADEFLWTVGTGSGSVYVAGYVYTVDGYNVSGGNGDTCTTGALLAAGSYTFSVLGFTAAVAAKVDWYVDGTLIVGGQDWYSAGTVGGVLKTSSVVVALPGWHQIKGIVNGKNASSSGYFLQLAKLYFTPAADTTNV